MCACLLPVVRSDDSAGARGYGVSRRVLDRFGYTTASMISLRAGSATIGF